MPSPRTKPRQPTAKPYTIGQLRKLIQACPELPDDMPIGVQLSGNPAILPLLDVSVGIPTAPRMTMIANANAVLSDRSPWRNMRDELKIGSEYKERIWYDKFGEEHVERERVRL